MRGVAELFDHSLSLLTDLYQLTMAYGYWKLGRADREAVFHLSFRKHPFGGGYAVACGLHYVDRLPVRAARSTTTTWTTSPTLTGNDGKPLFDRGFLDYLATMQFACDVDAVPEGTVVFPHEPLVRVRGPILQCQILETPLLNLVNFQTLIATKAARVCSAAQGRAGAGVRPPPGAGDRRRRSPPAGPRTSAGAPRRATCWPASCSASPSAARTPTVG